MWLFDRLMKEVLTMLQSIQVDKNAPRHSVLLARSYCASYITEFLYAALSNISVPSVL